MSTSGMTVSGMIVSGMIVSGEWRNWRWSVHIRKPDEGLESVVPKWGERQVAPWSVYEGAPWGVHEEGASCLMKHSVKQLVNIDIFLKSIRMFIR